jgi:hypothetical protein
MFDPREKGHPVVIVAGREPSLAPNHKLGAEIHGATVFYCGAGALRSLFCEERFKTEIEAGAPVVVICSNPHEAFALRGRLTARTGLFASPARPIPPGEIPQSHRSAPSSVPGVLPVLKVGARDV